MFLQNGRYWRFGKYKLFDGKEMFYCLFILSYFYGYIGYTMDYLVEIASFKPLSQ